MKLSAAKIIIIEGLDGTGKSVQAKLLAEKIGGEYIKGGGWNKDSNLAQRKMNRNTMFTLMQMEKGRELRERQMAETKSVLVVDRFGLVDITHWLAKGWKEENKRFTEESLEQARKNLDLFFGKGKRAIRSEEIVGFILDIGDKQVLKERINSRDGGGGTETDVDTLRRFEAKREAYRWCAKELGWRLVNAEGTREEVAKVIWAEVEKRVIMVEGQVTISNREHGN